MSEKIAINSAEDIARMREIGRKASELLDFITPYVKPGVTTKRLDDLMLEYTYDVLHCKSACLHYAPYGMTPYPAATCISVNHVICHGIPSEKKKLKDGDIVNIDITITDGEYFGDNSRMFMIGKPSIAGKRLSEATYEAMWKGIEVVKPGNCFNDIGIAIRNYCDPLGLAIVREYGGHGIGREFHGAPHVSHYPLTTPTATFVPGMIFTVEPMINAGRRHIMNLNDGWTVVTKDRSLSAQWELEVLVTETGYDILTVSAGSREAPEWVKGWKKPDFSAPAA
ncbi:MAG TPA: type I methionyl aminopeptidase [Sutterella sp.]|nr:type I methionyl aminopeptidase [Sutterella sp.]